MCKTSLPNPRRRTFVGRIDHGYVTGQAPPKLKILPERSHFGVAAVYFSGAKAWVVG
jgi:hypothetical protein